LFKTRWKVSGVDIEIGDYFMGHDIDDLGYDKSPRDYPDFYRDSYMRAEPWLNVLSQDPERVPRAEMERRLGERDRQMREWMEEVQLYQEKMSREIEELRGVKVKRNSTIRGLGSLWVGSALMSLISQTRSERRSY
jgi:hypothetical protein